LKPNQQRHEVAVDGLQTIMRKRVDQNAAGILINPLSLLLRVHNLSTESKSPSAHFHYTIIRALDDRST